MTKQKSSILMTLIAFLFFASPVAAQGQSTAELLSLAMGGDPSAQVSLALRYRDGVGVAQDDAKALEWLRRAAAQGYAEGQHGLGRFYLNGIGTPSDSKLCYENFLAAANQGFDLSIIAMSIIYYQGKCVPELTPDDHAAEAVMWMRRAIDVGHLESLIPLAATLYDWPDLMLHPNEPEHLLLRAAQANMDNANEWLAFIYETGVGASRDYGRAVFYRSLSAQEGNENSVAWLADNGFDLDGKPVRAEQTSADVPDSFHEDIAIQIRQRDADGAALLEQILPSARAGDMRAYENLFALFQFHEFAGAEELYEEWLPTLSDAGVGHAMLQIAIKLTIDKQSRGEPVLPKDAQDARTLLERAFAIGDPELQIAIEVIAEEGLGDDPNDWARSFDWYLAQAVDDPYAQNRLALMYVGEDPLGQVAPVLDHVAGVCWFSKSVITDEPLLGQMAAIDGVDDVVVTIPMALSDSAQKACSLPTGMSPSRLIDQAIGIYAGEITTVNEAGTFWAAGARLRLAAYAGDAQAQYRYGRYVESRDRAEQALAWYKLAANQGYAPAQFVMGERAIEAGDLAQGDAKAAHYEQALAWNMLAANQGYGLALRSLSILYDIGVGVPKNDALSTLWGVRADAAGVPSGDDYFTLIFAKNIGLDPN